MKMPKITWEETNTEMKTKELGMIAVGAGICVLFIPLVASIALIVIGMYLLYKGDQDDKKSTKEKTV